MLVLSRKPQQTIVVEECITITVVEICGNQVRLGIEAPRHIAVRRGELRPQAHAGSEQRTLVEAKEPFPACLPFPRERKNGSVANCDVEPVAVAQEAVN